MTQSVMIRPTKIDDIPILSEFWYDQMVLLQQANPRVQLAPAARQQWEFAAKAWLMQPNIIALTGVLQDEIMGAMWAAIIPNTPGLLPVQIAHLFEFVIDIHTPQTQLGTGRHLLIALKQALVQRQITHLQVTVSSTAAVEQAFWRGMGAKNHDEIFWMVL